jgi:hypothetical protein
MTVPDRTPEQRALALETAMAARQERARLREALRSREIAGVDVLSGGAENPLWSTLKVTWLLESLPGLGVARTEGIMTRLRISPSRRVQGLGPRQRAALIAELAGR